MRAQTALVALGSLCLAPPALAASTDFEKFERKVARYAHASGSVDHAKPRGLCTCVADEVAGVVQTHTGVLVYSPASMMMEFSLTVSCEIPFFDADGALARTSPCKTWTLLSR
jgi:hypothetical protein